MRGTGLLRDLRLDPKGDVFPVELGSFYLLQRRRVRRYGLNSKRHSLFSGGVNGVWDNRSCCTTAAFVQKYRKTIRPTSVFFIVSSGQAGGEHRL